MGLTCTVCNVPIGDCICEGVDESLKKVAFDPNGHVAFKWCRKCDKHYARCKCEQPDFAVVARGKFLDPSTVYQTLAGPIQPNLNAR